MLNNISLNFTGSVSSVAAQYELNKIVTSNVTYLLWYICNSS